MKIGFENILFPGKEPPLKLPSAAEMAAFDRATIDAGISSPELMEKAGSAIFQAFSKILKSDTGGGKTVILCGPGNNGGDGLVLARLLITSGIRPVVIAAGAKRYSDDHALMARRLKDAGGEILLFSAGDDKHPYVNEVPVAEAGDSLVTGLVSGSAFIIDALLGTGQKNAPSGNIAPLCRIAAGSAGVKISIDVPTGIDADTGYCHDPAIKADRTLSIELIKRGMLQHPAREACGVIEVLPIGIDTTGPCGFSITATGNPPLNLNRKTSGHKGDFGTVFVVGGSYNMPGAPVLSASAALRSGSGLVTLTRLKDPPPVEIMPELMLFHLKEPGGHYTEAHLDEVLKRAVKADAVVTGPGMGQEKDSAGFLKGFLAGLVKEGIKGVIDADALNLIATDGSIAEGVDFSGFVLTPHPGEAARLLGCSTAEVQRDRYSAARLISEKFNAAVLLKGASTVIYGSGSGYVNLTGNPFMATAGAGDVLCGVIASLIGQGLCPLSAAACGAWIHGTAGDVAAGDRTPVIASDIIRAIPDAFLQVNG